MNQIQDTTLILNLNNKEEEKMKLQLYRKWKQSCENDNDAIRMAMKEFEHMKEEQVREMYWERVHNHEVERANSTGLEDKPNPTWDKEELSNLEISLMEYYISYSQWLENHPVQQMWEDLRAKRSHAWSQFMEELEFNWLRVDRYEEKLSHRIFLLEKTGKTPTPESWDKAMEHLSKLKDQVIRYYEDDEGQLKVDYRGYQGATMTSMRNHITYPLFQKAMDATEACRNFWFTKEGKALNEFREKRGVIWVAIKEHGLQGRFGELFRIQNQDIDLNLVWGYISEDMDTPTLQEEDKKSDLSPAFWYQLAGLPTEDHYEVCIYETGDKTPTRREDIEEYYKLKHDEEEVIMAEIDQDILENTWSMEEEEEYQASLSLSWDEYADEAEAVSDHLNTYQG